MLLGYNENTTKQYRVWDKSGRRVITVAASNVKFNEQSFRYRDLKQEPTLSSSVGPSTLSYLRSLVSNEYTNTSTNQRASMTIEPTLQAEAQPETSLDLSNEGPQETLRPQRQPQQPQGQSEPLRQSTRKRMPSFKVRTALSARVRNSMEPISYRDALKHHYSLQWKVAIKEEIQALDRNRTWDLVDEATVLQSGKRVIGSKWVYKVKRNADGSSRYKARLVIKGYEQEYGIDY